MTNFADAWNTTYEGQPADSENINLGAGRIRNLKVDLRQRMAVDHSWDDGLTVASNDGKHLQATLRVSAAKPALDATDGAVYTKVVAGRTELFYEDSAGAEVQLTTGGVIDSTPSFPSGTVLPFYQAAPPTGWTQVTGHNDRVLIIDDDDGGTDGGSWTISGVTVATTTVDNASTATPTIATHVLSAAELPAHTHTVNVGVAGFATSGGSPFIGNSANSSVYTTDNGTGGGGAHGHAGSTVALSLHMTSTSTPSSDGSWRPAYANMILASKN